MIYFIISTVLFIGGIIIIHWLHNQYQMDIIVEPTPPPHSAPLISVCIPARDEARNIRACVRAALEQDYPNFEIIVLDDRSTDSTPELLRELAAQNDRLKILSGSDLPKGWAGKPHALFQASAAAQGHWLCFIDADTFLTPNALSACYRKASETQADLFTIMTFQILGSFWEKIVMPIIMTALSVGFSPHKVNDPDRKDAVANGQFILIKRSVYNAIGGHESVKNSIVEDKAISEQVKWRGYRLVVADGMKMVRTRMYTSLPEIWEGWTKNIYLGLHDQPSLVALGIFGAFLAMLTAFFFPIWPFLGVFWYFNGGNWMAIMVTIQALLIWSYIIYVRSIIATKLDISPWYSLTTSLGAAIFGVMMFASAWKVISRKGVTWKGRVYTSE